MAGPDAAVARHPTTTLTAAFTAWKAFLLAVAAGASTVGDAYDTSAGLMLGDGIGGAQLLVARLVSWDAVYYVAAARRGYEFEQEWAFGRGLPAVASWLAAGVRTFGGVCTSGAGDGLFLEALMGILVANASHLLSVLVLHRLGLLVWQDSKLALVAALLHVFSPAGIFLVAPYSEAPFALLSFAGYLLFALRFAHEQAPAFRDACTILSGVLFGLASTFRSNGLLNGLPFAWEFLRSVLALRREFPGSIGKMVALGLGGLAIALGTVVPQLVAYQRFCVAGVADVDVRPWCEAFPPSIYAFVQEHYWNVGFLRYWTLSNLPLFLLAAPMLFVLARSGVEYLQSSTCRAQRPASGVFTPLVGCLALIQVVLAVLAATTYHVQIITRLSSGYPLWHWWLASKLISREESSLATGIVMFAVMYAAIQGALFASFLPPA